MPVTYVDLKGWTLKLADTQAGLASATVNPSCQISSAQLAASPQTTSTDPTFCADGASVISSLQYALDVTFYLDATDPAGFHWYLWNPANALAWKWFELTMVNGTTPAGKFIGEVQIAPSSVGGARSAGPGSSQVTLPCRNITGTPPTVPLEAEAETAAPVQAAAGPEPEPVPEPF